MEWLRAFPIIVFTFENWKKFSMVTSKLALWGVDLWNILGCGCKHRFVLLKWWFGQWTRFVVVSTFANK